MECLIGKIGLSGCGTSDPAPELLINSLPGISLKSIESLADSEQQTYIGVWNDIELRSSKRFAIEVYSKLAERYKLSTITRAINTGTGLDATNILAASPSMRGVVFDLDWNSENEMVNSVMLYHYIPSFTFYSTGVHAGVPFLIKDVETGSTLDTFTKDITSGINSVTVGKVYSNRKIFLCIDTTSLTTVYIKTSENCHGCDCSGSAKGGYYTIADGITTLTETDNGFGFNVSYSSICKYNALVCSNIKLFLTPFWYLCGSELMQERLSSERVNKWTVNRKEAEELKAYYDKMFYDSLSSVISGINLDTNDCCIDCDDTYVIKEAMP